MRRRKKTLFKTSLLIYTIVGLILSIIFLVYIYLTLKSYEASQTDNYLKNYITSLDDKTLKKFLSDNNQSEDLLVDYKKEINDKDIKIKKIDEENFEVILNKRVLFDIKVKNLGTETKLGLFSYEKIEVEEVIPNLKRGMKYYDVIIPSNYVLYVDDKKVSDTKLKEKYENLDYMYVSDAMPYIAKYEINNLVNEAKIKVLNEYGEEVKLNEKQFEYTLDKNYLSFDSYDEAKKYLSSEIDIWEFAHNWSLYLTKDLKGVSYGFNTLRPYFIEGTQMYQRAYNWAHSIDITFTSKHTLKNPTFTNEVLNNFKVYSKDAFSCEISLEKNMVVAGKDQVDKMHDTLYFVKYNGEWKVVNIKSGG